MTNTTAQSLIAEIQKNRSLYHKFAMKLSKRPEVADDLMQQVVFKFLSTDEFPELRNHKQYVMNAIVHANWNYWHVNKRYKFSSDMVADGFTDTEVFDTLMQTKVGCTYEQDIHYSLKLKEIRKAAKLLPPGQQKAIVDALNGNDIGEELGIENASFNPRYESLKTNKRLATQKLKKQFKE